MAAKFSMLHTEKVERCRGLGIPALACSVAVFGAELHKTLLVEIMSPCTRTHTQPETSVQDLPRGATTCDRDVAGAVPKLQPGKPRTIHILCNVVEKT